MNSFVSKVPPIVSRNGEHIELSAEAQETLTFNKDLIAKAAESIAMKVLPLSTFFDKEATIDKEADTVQKMIYEAVHLALSSGTELGAKFFEKCYGIEAAIGQYQDYDNRGNELGPREIRLMLDIIIPIDELYLKLPPKVERKAKRMWDKATKED